MIKISTLNSSLHDKGAFSQENNNFLGLISSKINEELVISDLNDYDCDLKLIFIASGGSEMLFKNKIGELKEPFYLLTSGDNNSLAASLEILTYLNSLHLKGEIIHGSLDYIASRIKSLENKNNNLNLFNNERYGVIGNPSDWLIASIPNYEEVTNKLNISLVPISLNELINNFYEEKVDDDFNDLGFNRDEVNKALRIYEALNKIVNKYQLSGLTVRCFDLLDSIKGTSCLGLAKLNEKGIIATCEGDIMAMISMAIIKKISNESSFQANPSRIDVENNEIVFAHCTLPLDMVYSYNYKTHFESDIGVAIQGKLKLETVTIFRLGSDLKSYFVSKGKIIRNLDDSNLCRTQIVVKLEKDVKELLTSPCGNHHIIFYGDYVKKIEKIFNK